MQILKIHEDHKHNETVFYDVYVTTVRRKYIPPLIENYQDIIVTSVFDYKNQSDDGEEFSKQQRRSQKFLREVHQQVVDTLHPKNRQNVEKQDQFVMHKSDALMMDEDSMSFFANQLNRIPVISQMASLYMISIIE